MHPPPPPFHKPLYPLSLDLLFKRRGGRPPRVQSERRVLWGSRRQTINSGNKNRKPSLSTRQQFHSNTQARTRSFADDNSYPIHFFRNSLMPHVHVWLIETTIKESARAGASAHSAGRDATRRSHQERRAPRHCSRSRQMVGTSPDIFPRLQ